MHLYFSDIFEVSPKVLDKYGAFNISLITDLPLFIDPFLLFNSKKKEYRQLHDDIIKYLRFLKDKSIAEAKGKRARHIIRGQRAEIAIIERRK